jgi:hypothetical protein
MARYGAPDIRLSLARAIARSAGHAAAALANTFVEGGVAVVIAEGSCNTPSDRAAFEQHLDRSIGRLYVTLRVRFEEALRRAQGDPTRGISRDPAFLGPYFAARTRALSSLPETDLVIDTEQATVQYGAATVQSAAETITSLVWARRSS